MKTKIIIAFILIGIGGILIAVGYVMGGSAEAIDLGRISCFSTVETPLISDGVQIKNMHTEIACAELKVIPFDGNGFTYSIINNTEEVSASVSVKGDTLHIKTKKQSRGFLKEIFSNNKVHKSKTVITLKVPKNFTFDVVDINAGAGVLFLDSFNVCKAFRLKAGIEEAQVHNITASGVLIQTGVGNTAFKNCTFTGTKMETGIGKTVFEGKILKQLKIDTGIGETVLHINGKREEYHLDISGIGKVSVNGASFTPAGNTSFSANNPGAAHKIQIRNGIGSLQVRFAE